MDFGAQELHRDAISIVSGDPQSVLWNGESYEGMVGPLVTTKPNIEGGFLPEYDLSWTTSIKKLDASGALISRFFNDVIPAEGNELTIPDIVPPGITYSIDRITRDRPHPFTVMVQFDLMSKDKH